MLPQHMVLLAQSDAVFAGRGSVEIERGLDKARIRPLSLVARRLIVGFVFRCLMAIDAADAFFGSGTWASG